MPARKVGQTAAVLTVGLLCSASSAAPTTKSTPRDERAHIFAGGMGGRQLATCTTDDALDVIESPEDRAIAAGNFRRDLVDREQNGSVDTCQASNIDTDLATKFSKTLPHNDFGEVDAESYYALEACIEAGDFETCESVPAGDGGAKLVNPLGGIAFDLGSPAGSAVMAPPTPTLDSIELATQLAECYWMALARDVPFEEYDTHAITIAAAENLAAMGGLGQEADVAMNADGTIDPLKQLFRASFVGVDKGPMMSQLLANDFTMDSIDVSIKQTTYAAGFDYMTSWASFLNIQNGGSPSKDEELDDTKRYIRNGRDLSRLVYTDTIYTEAFRGALVLMDKGGFSRSGANGPYADSSRQGGFVQWGASHIMKALGSGEAAQRSAWYQKWNVHMMLRPEALGSLVHLTMHGDIVYPINDALLTNTELLDLVVSSNARSNALSDALGEPDSYLLSQAVGVGSPAHPSYPAGHAVQNGAFATILKALSGLENGQQCVPNPVYSSSDGSEMFEYVPTSDETCIGSDGVETTGLTFEGEINKMSANVAFGRSHMGVHYRFDSTEGMILGETFAVRMLHTEIMALPEGSPYEFNLFRGQTIVLNHDGSFSVDGVTCSGEVYTGADEC